MNSWFRGCHRGVIGIVNVRTWPLVWCIRNIDRQRGVCTCGTAYMVVTFCPIVTHTCRDWQGALVQRCADMTLRRGRRNLSECAIVIKCCGKVFPVAEIHIVLEIAAIVEIHHATFGCCRIKGDERVAASFIGSSEMDSRKTGTDKGPVSRERFT
jgi:hypothetical protein